MEVAIVITLLVLFGIYFRANRENIGDYFDKNY